MIRINLLGHEDRRPRYQQLRDARGHLQSAHEYLRQQVDRENVLAPEWEALRILEEAARYVKGELRRSWAFNTDGSPRVTRQYDSSHGPARGPFPPTHGIEGASRQVRRALARVVGFSQMSFVHTREVDGQQKSGRSPAMPRGLRRQIAKGAKFPTGDSNDAGTGQQETASAN